MTNLKLAEPPAWISSHLHILSAADALREIPWITYTPETTKRAFIRCAANPHYTSEISYRFNDLQKLPQHDMFIGGWGVSITGNLNNISFVVDLADMTYFVYSGNPTEFLTLLGRTRDIDLYDNVEH